MSKVKTQWTQPQLIVLARGTPEETLTLGCKMIDPNVYGPDGVSQSMCENPDSPSVCAACQARNQGT